MRRQDSQGFQNSSFMHRFHCLANDGRSVSASFVISISTFGLVLCRPRRQVYNSINYQGYFHFARIKADSWENHVHSWDWKSSDDWWAVFLWTIMTHIPRRWWSPKGETFVSTTVHSVFFCENFVWFLKTRFLGGIGSNFQEWFVIPLSMLEFSFMW